MLPYTERYIDHANTPETQARARRLRAFRSASQFIEVLNLESVKHQTICEMVKAKTNGLLDHISFWELGNMAVVMSEPYHGDLVDFKCDGLYAVEVPVTIAPYCGNWNEGPGAMSGTKSFLITSILKRRQLDEVLERLKEEATQ